MKKINKILHRKALNTPYWLEPTGTIMSSIDDEFASLFLPDLELINSMNNSTSNGANTYASAAGKRWEEPLVSPYSMNDFAIDNQGNNNTAIHSDRNTTSSHWLHHYGKLSNTYDLPLNHLQQPYIGYNSQSNHLPQMSNSSILMDPSSNNSLNHLDIMSFQRFPETIGPVNGDFEEQDNEMKQSFPVDAVQRPETRASQPISHTVRNHTNARGEPQTQRKKKISSSKYAYLLNLETEPLEKSVTLYDDLNQRVKFDAFGEIDGRFMYTESELNDPLTNRISCYRRNYIQISFDFQMERRPKYISSNVSANKALLSGFKIGIYATTNFSDDKIELLVFDNDGKKSSTAPGVTYMGSFLHELPVDKICSNYNEKFLLRKTQFRSATPNNGKATIFQNYYYIFIAVSAVTQGGGDIPLISLKSRPIKVRGRNPSFYNDRDDIFIVKDNKSSSFKDSTSVTSNNKNNFSGENSQPLAMTEFSTGTPVIPEEAISRSNHDLQTFVEAPLRPELKSQEEEKISPQLPSSNLPYGSKSATPPNYEYFPLSSVYYLPPLDAHYFPHGVHHPRQSSIVRHREKSEAQEKKGNVFEDSGNGSLGDEKIVNNRYIKMKLMDIMNYEKNANTIKH